MGKRRRQPWSKADMEMLVQLSRPENRSAGSRLRIFRDWLARNVCLASSLLLNACMPDELDDAFWRLWPPPAWPGRRQVQTMITGMRGREDRYVSDRFVIVEDPSAQPSAMIDRIGVRVSSRSAHMVLRTGEVIITTSDEGGRMSVPRELDPRKRSALEGLMLDAVLRHPILNGQPYEIISVRPARTPGRSVIEFGVAPEEWRVPWNRPWDVPF